MRHWLYSIIPGDRTAAPGWRLLPWAIWGNDEDGIAGERDWYRERAGVVVTFGTFVAWQMRNPCHNLLFHVLAWKRPLQIVAVASPPRRWFFSQAPQTWPAPIANCILIAVLPPLISFRAGPIEGYAGWRGSGALGFALRRCSFRKSATPQDA